MGQVSDAEVDMVLHEAEIIGDGRPGRGAVMRSLAAWFMHVQREDSSWPILLCASGRWIRERGYYNDFLHGLDSYLTWVAYAMHLLQLLFSHSACLIRV